MQNVITASLILRRFEQIMFALRTGSLAAMRARAHRISAGIAGFAAEEVTRWRALHWTASIYKSRAASRALFLRRGPVTGLSELGLDVCIRVPAL